MTAKIMSQKIWDVKATFDSSTPIVDQLVLSRGLVSDRELNEFYNPPLPLLYLKRFPPKFVIALKKAREQIKQAIKENTPILIHGDYDADGICATAILFNTLKYELEYENVFAFIPDRFKHGYGLTKESFESAKKKIKFRKGVETLGPILIITVDSGVTSHEEVSYIKNQGHSVIITDHHQLPDTLPEADTLVWNDTMVGASISWLLSQVLGSKDKTSISLAALATVTDVFELVGFNRSLVKYGLETLNETPPLGLEFLLESAGRKNKKITTYDLGWVLGPRLNAAGRLESASDALLLLVEKDPKILKDIVFKLNATNALRQEKTQAMLDMVPEFTGDIPRIIITSHTDYHDGIIGLVASSLVKKYNRPSVVVNIEDSVGKGSVRSISGIDIISILREYSDLFLNLGGHPMAAGFSIDTSNIALLEEKLNGHFESFEGTDVFVPRLRVDMQLPLNVVTLDFATELDKLRPFGVGNPKPVFLAKNMTVSRIKPVGSAGNHISLRFSDGDFFVNAIYFNGIENEDVSSVELGSLLDVVFFVEVNEFNGVTSVQLNVQDLHLVT